MLDLTHVDTVYQRKQRRVLFKNQAGWQGKLYTLTLKRHARYVIGAGARPKADNPGAAYRLLMSCRLGSEEHLTMLVLNVANDVTGFKVISSGTQSASAADAKIVFRNALMLGAAKILLAHNHPSGSLKPSSADIAFTQKIIDAGRSIDIPLVDHIIYTAKGYTSMRSEGHCEFEPFA